MSYDLKNEEEVKLYLQNLYTEYSFGCLSERNPETCHLLGEYYEAIKKNYKKSAEIHKNNCDNFDFAKSCSKYGRFSVVGDGCKQDVKQAYTYMKKGCELNDGNGCLYAGLLSLSKEDVGIPDKKTLIDKGVSMLEKGCNDLNEPRSCFFLAGLYMSGIPGYVEKDLRKGYDLSVKCCGFGNSEACANLARMHTLGEGAEKNLELAKTFRNRAIEIENELRQNQSIKFQQGINT